MNSSNYAKTKCPNCGSYEGEPRICTECGDECCDLCECDCEKKVLVYDSGYDYDLTSKINIPIVWYVTDTFDIHALVVIFGGQMFKLNDDELLKEVMKNGVAKLEYSKDFDWLASNVHKLPVIERGDV